MAYQISEIHYAFTHLDARQVEVATTLAPDPQIKARAFAMAASSVLMPPQAMTAHVMVPKAVAHVYTVREGDMGHISRMDRLAARQSHLDRLHQEHGLSKTDLQNTLFTSRLAIDDHDIVDAEVDGTSFFPRPAVDVRALRAERAERAARRGLTIRGDLD